MDNNKNGVDEQQEDKSKPMNEDAKVDQMETDKSGPPLSSKNSFEVPFSRAFPESRGTKLQKDWPTVKSALESYGISCTLNLVECSMTASLSSKARGNPLYMNLRARMLLLLLAIGVPAYMALRTLRPCPVILMIGHGSTGLCSKFRIEKEQYQKRRKLLLGSPLQDVIFISTKTTLLLHATGSNEGIKLAKKILTDCIVHRVHPATQIRKIKMMNQVIDGLGALRF